MNFEEFLVESIMHDLAGVVLIYNNKILLVRPKKFRKRMKKWSIPKGHIDVGMGKAETASHELEEESRIKIKKKKLKAGEKGVLYYSKARADKKLTYYVVKITRDEMNVKLFNNMILGNFLKKETVEAGFFSKSDAEQIIERPQLDLLKYLD